MTPEEFQQHARACTHFLPGHYPRSVRQRLQDIVDSPYSEILADNYGNGGFVAEFEKEIAELLGKEAAVVMPSGTMAQPIALRIWADRVQNKTVAFHPTCHLELHEHMAYRELHHLEAILLGEKDRLFTLEDLKAVEAPLSSLLIELPQREIGGQLPTWDELISITDYARNSGARLHLDGARLWESQPYFGRPYKEIVAGFDSVYVSFYKLLFGLPGAALAGPADFIAEARIWIRRQGGNLVNMFPTAIAAKVGMDRFLPQVPVFVAKAAEVASILDGMEGITVVPSRPPTTMMHIYVDASPEVFLDAVGQIAAREKVLLFRWVSPAGTGSKIEINIGEPALDIPTDRIRDLLAELMSSLE